MPEHDRTGKEHPRCVSRTRRGGTDTDAGRALLGTAGRRPCPGRVLAVALGLPVLLLLLAAVAHALSVRSLDVETLVSRADRIFVGRCVAVGEVSAGGPAGMPVTEITFAVVESLKPARGLPLAGEEAGASPAHGASGPRLITIKQLGGRNTPGLGPRFRVGEETLLFLHRESSWGLTSPVGMGQGKFTIVRRAPGAGADLAVNAFAPSAVGGEPSRVQGLSGSISAERLQRNAQAAGRGGTHGAVELEPFLEAIRGLVAGGGGN